MMRIEPSGGNIGQPRHAGACHEVDPADVRVAQEVMLGRWRRRLERSDEVVWEAHADQDTTLLDAVLVESGFEGPIATTPGGVEVDLAGSQGGQVVPRMEPRGTHCQVLAAHGPRLDRVAFMILRLVQPFQPHAGWHGCRSTTRSDRGIYDQAMHERQGRSRIVVVSRVGRRTLTALVPRVPVI